MQHQKEIIITMSYTPWDRKSSARWAKIITFFQTVVVHINFMPLYRRHKTHIIHILQKRHCTIGPWSNRTTYHGMRLWCRTYWAISSLFNFNKNTIFLLKNEQIAWYWAPPIRSTPQSYTMIPRSIPLWTYHSSYI